MPTVGGGKPCAPGGRVGGHRRTGLHSNCCGALERAIAIVPCACACVRAGAGCGCRCRCASGQTGGRAGGCAWHCVHVALSSIISCAFSALLEARRRAPCDARNASCAQTPVTHNDTVTTTTAYLHVGLKKATSYYRIRSHRGGVPRRRLRPSRRHFLCGWAALAPAQQESSSGHESIIVTPG